MRILVQETGQTSLRWRVIDSEPERQVFRLELERIADVEAGVARCAALLAGNGIHDIDALAHRVPDGGDEAADACRLDPARIEALASTEGLGPLGNARALAGIHAAARHWPSLPQVAVFDTAFHRRMPACARTYALPAAWRETGFRRLGFHGISHRDVMRRCSAALRATPADLRIISCHLGRQASVCAIEHGVSIDCSMGAGGLEGLVGATQSGDVDASLFGHLQRSLGLSVEQVEQGLRHESGLFGLAGPSGGGGSGDVREIERRAAAGSESARLALDVYAYRVRKAIGACAAALGGVDLIAFTGSIGEHSALLRARICGRLDFLGAVLDEALNRDARPGCGAVLPLHQPHSRVKVLAAESRVAWAIAREAEGVLREAC